MRTMTPRRHAAWRAAVLAALTSGTGLGLSGCGGSPFEDSPKDMYALSQSSVSCDAAPATVCADVKLYATPINGLGTDYRPSWQERPAVANNKAVDHVYRDLQADGRWLLSVGFTSGLKAGTYSGTIEFGPDPLSGDTLITPDANGLTLSARGLDSLSTVRWTAQAYNPPLNLAGLIRWGVTAGNGRVHVNAGDRLRGFALGDGARQVDIVTPGKSPVVLFSTALNQHPVLLDAGTATVITHRDLRPGEGRDNQWSVVDLAGGQTRWTQSGRYMDLPVGNNGVVYASNQENKTVEARSVANGSLLWSWPMDAGDSYFQRQMVLTNQHLFVSTDRQTIAIDLGTHQAVWRYGAGGALAMSANGTLTLMVERSAQSNRPMLVTFDVR